MKKILGICFLGLFCVALTIGCNSPASSPTSSGKTEKTEKDGKMTTKEEKMTKEAAKP